MDLYTVRQQLNMGIPLAQMKLRVTDYSRVSTDHLEQKSSLKNQIEHFYDMIKNNPNWTYVPGYVDDGISGTTDFKRDNFMQMIDDAKNKKFDLIVTKEISRFSRNTLDSIKYTRELLSYGVAVLFVNDNINTALPDAELRLTIMASMAQDEIRRLSERVKFGMKQSIKNGNILGNDLLFGYKKNKDTGNLVIIPEEAKIVTRIFREYSVEKKSLNRIANDLNKDKINTALKRKWTSSTLSRMIKNVKYKGYYCGKKSEIIDYMTKKVKYFPENDWVMYEDNERIPPIIKEELWDMANERLNSRKKSFGNDYKDKSIYQNRYPLSAKIFCSEHNEVFHRRKQCKATNDITWTCAEYLKNGKSACDSPNIRESEIYGIFDDIIYSLSIRLEKVSDILMDLYQHNKNNVGIDSRMAELNTLKAKYLEKKDKLLELNIEGNLSNKEFFDRNNECNTEIEKIDIEIADLERSKKNFSEIEKNNKKLERILKQTSKTIKTKERLMELLLNKIVVSKINNDKNNLELNIFFNFSKNFFTKDEKSSLIPSSDGLQRFMRKEYEYKRGENIPGAKRYIVKYKVNAYICI